MDREDQSTLRARLRADPARFGDFVEQHRDRLRTMVHLRLDPRLQGRLDASDVVQDAFAEAVGRLPEWLDDGDMPLHLWLRFITAQKLVQIHRHHLETEMRDAGREVPLVGGAPEASAVSLASAIADSRALTASRAAMTTEAIEKLRRAIETMKPEDREVLVLRHFEQMSNADVARVLGITSGGASLRYMRAATRLRALLDGVGD